MDQLIKQKYQPLSNNYFLSFISGSTMSLFGNPEKVTNIYRPVSNIKEMKYFHLADTIYAFSGLKKNWDSYNADTISKIAIESAINLLNNLFINGLFKDSLAVHIFPMRDGGIQFEFDGCHICAELEINQNGDINFILFDDDGNILENVKIFELSEIPSLLEESQYA